MIDATPSFLAADAHGIARAAAWLAAGELVAFPTETVYGLGADASDPLAVARLYAAKGRPADHPSIVHIAAGSDPLYWVRRIPPAAQALIDAFWPGPLTLILPRAAHVCDAVSGGQDSVGLRCPSHPVAQALLAAFSSTHRAGRGGVAAPSANRFGRVSPSTAQHVRDEFGDRVHIVDGGACEVGIESTIIDLSRGFPALLRPGGVSAKQIADVLGEMPRLPASMVPARHEVPINSNAQGVAEAPAPRASGTLKSHYAPSTPLALMSIDDIVGTVAARERSAPGARIAVVARSAAAGRFAAARGVHFVAAPETPQAYARMLYALLRSLDSAGVVRILIEKLPATPEWAAVNDRLGRAAAAFDVGE